MADLRILPEGPPLVVAHRGASVAQPENTLEAFEAAVATGAEILELDVRLSADGVPVVVHDPDVARSTNGQGLVHEMTVKELKRLDAAPGRPERAEIPTLGEVLALASGTVGVDLEIKNIPGEPGFDSPREAVVAATLLELERAAFSGEALISSFNWLTIERSKELAPGVATGFLTIGVVEADAALVYARGAGHEWILPQVEAVLRAGPGFLDEAHEARIRVGTWVVDDEEGLRTLFQWKIDAVATNDPELAIRIRGSTGGGNPAGVGVGQG
jgi:glycerophosphoryl diester phosphodiesterase